MGAAGRAFLALALLGATACGTVHPQVASATSAKPSIPWLPLAPAHQYVEAPPAVPESPIRIPAGTSPCKATQLEGVSMGEGAAAGNVNMPLLFRNRSSADCVVQGYLDVTVLDSRGAVLVKSTGVAGRGTFFADGPVVPLLMDHGTAFPPTPESGIGQGVPGQAFMNFSWYDCRQPRATHLAIDLPSGGGRFLVPFALRGDASPVCDGRGKNVAAAFRGPLTPTGFAWPPEPDYITVKVDLSAPQTVRHGATVSFLVTITNTSAKTYDMRPCADYDEILKGSKGVFATYQLNCEPAGSLAPGAKATFAMKANLPADLPQGRQYMTWYLKDGRLAAPGAGVWIDVT